METLEADQAVGPVMTSVRGGSEDKGPGRRPSLTERRMARTRRQLAEVAARLFLERGYESVTVEEIVAAVEVSPRTFFRYFTSKEDVLDEILLNEAEVVTAALRARPAEEPILEALQGAARSWLSTTQQHEGTLTLFALVLRTPVLRSRWLVRRRDCQEALAQVLVERLNGEPSPRVLLLAAGAIIAVVATIFEFWVDNFDEREALALIDEALDALVGGFGLGERP
ncbi:MAG: TetR family transcriptional regulator [Acidimicrobiales bacterium]